jgi:PAS domain S-box-containing protein
VSTLVVGSFALLGTLALLAVVGRLLRERRRSSDALAHSEALFRSLVENAIDIVAVLDGGGRFEYVSPSVERILGYKPSELQGRTALDLVADEDKPMIAATFAQGLRDPGSSQGATCSMLDAQGRPHLLVTRGSAVTLGGVTRAVLSLRDITEERRALDAQKRLHSQLAQAQKMETFGTLASGIAHDFNNLLTPILGGAELALSTLPPESPARDLFTRIEKSARRARELVQRMVLLGKSSAGEQRVVNLTALVNDTLELLRAALPKSIDISSSLPDEPLPVLADEVQIQQALLNLTANAADAMRKAPGTLRVQMRLLSAEDRARSMHPSLRQGRWVHVEVSDSGEGMDEETVRRAFEPFFSTKEIGRGEGLGLSVVHGIVNGHGGVIDLSSTIGMGTRIDVYLPIHEQLARVEEPAPVNEVTSQPRILLVDDEPSVASVCRELLRLLGYEVEVATDPREALARFEAEPNRFDLVVTDHSMPHMTGLQLAVKLCDARRVPIVLTTGFAQDDLLTGSNRELVAEIVAKPYAIEELEGAIQRALATAAQRARASA